MLPDRYWGLICWTMLTCLIAGAYGALHDQLSYTISPDYFLVFKFDQFKISPDLPPRVGAAMVGWLASWWMGIVIGPLLYILADKNSGPNSRTPAMLRGLALLLVTTIVCGGVALAYGWLTINHANVWPTHGGVRDSIAFARVGTMHAGSYLGGLLGLIVAWIDMQWNASRALVNDPPEER